MFTFCLLAMAFITYILLAGMALGIQKRLLILPHLIVLWLTVNVFVSNKLNKKCVLSLCEGSVQRFLDCVPALPSCGSSSRSWWCCWACICWRYTATSRPLTLLPTVDTNMLGKCHVIFKMLMILFYWQSIVMVSLDQSSFCLL